MKRLLIVGALTSGLLSHGAFAHYSINHEKHDDKKMRPAMQLTHHAEFNYQVIRNGESDYRNKQLVFRQPVHDRVLIDLALEEREAQLDIGSDAKANRYALGVSASLWYDRWYTVNLRAHYELQEFDSLWRAQDIEYRGLSVFANHLLRDDRVVEYGYTYLEDAKGELDSQHAAYVKYKVSHFSHRFHSVYRLQGGSEEKSFGIGISYIF